MTTSKPFQTLIYSNLRSFLDDWIYEEGEYVGISLINLPFLGSDSMLAPKSRTDDGILHLLVSSFSYIKTILNFTHIV
jgi:hypothetical protein